MYTQLILHIYISHQTCKLNLLLTTNISHFHIYTRILQDEHSMISEAETDRATQKCDGDESAISKEIKLPAMINMATCTVLLVVTLKHLLHTKQKRFFFYGKNAILCTKRLRWMIT